MKWDAARSNPKTDLPWRSEEYLAYVASRKCCLCESRDRVCAAHFGGRGTGQKPPDYQSCPLCFKCHKREHGRPGYAPLTRDDREAMLWAALRLAGTFLAAARTETLDIDPEDELTYRERIEAGRARARRRKKKTTIGCRKEGSRRPPKRGMA